MEIERRRSPRRTITTEVVVVLPGGAIVLSSRLTDLSLGGAFVRSIRPLATGSRVQIDLQRGPHRNPLRMDAEVARVGLTQSGSPHGWGLRFLNVTDADEIALEQMFAEVD